MENSQPQNREDTGRNPDGTFKSGVSGNPGGRPKGTLKEYVSKMLREMPDEQKEKWLKEHNISGIDQWKMAEGNPETKSDVTIKDEGTNLSPEALKIAQEYEKKLNEVEDKT